MHSSLRKRRGVGSRVVGFSSIALAIYFEVHTFPMTTSCKWYADLSYSNSM